MQMRSLHFMGLMALAIVSLRGQSIVYWSPTAPDCSSLMGGETAVAVKDSAGHTLGYSCYVSGTFVWLAAGGVDFNPASWSTVIRVAAPASGNIDADYTFFDTGGTAQSLDNTLNNDSTTLASSNEVEVQLASNTPLELELLGQTGDGPNYPTTAEGSVYATFYCPDATTCANVLPQLMYSALPTYPWSLSVPIAWDDQLSSQWSGVINYDGVTNVASFVVYNEDSTANSYTIDVYDENGNLAGSGATPSIPPLPSSGGNGGTYAAVLSDVVPGLSPGFYKVLIDGGSLLSAVEMLQINGQSATTLQVAFDSAPGTAAAVKLRASHVRTVRVPSTHGFVARTVRKRGA